jgi:hypothetical protein
MWPERVVRVVPPGEPAIDSDQSLLPRQLPARLPPPTRAEPEQRQRERPSPTPPVARPRVSGLHHPSPPPHIIAEIDLKLLMTQLKYHRSDTPTELLFPVTAYVAHYWAHHTQYMDWLREQGRDSWTGDIGAMSGGSGGDRPSRRDVGRNRYAAGLIEEGRSDESEEGAEIGWHSRGSRRLVTKCN